MNIKQELTRAVMALVIIIGMTIPVMIINTGPVHAIVTYSNQTIQGEGNQTDGSYGGAPGNYNNVNSDDNATSYLLAPGMNVQYYHDYNMTTFTPLVSSITNLTLTFCASGGFTSSLIRYTSYVKINGIKYYGTGWAPYDGDGMNWAKKVCSITLNPATSAAWKPSEINSALFGVRYAAYNVQNEISYMMMNVYYEPGLLPTVNSSSASKILYVLNHQAEFNGAINNTGIIENNCTNYGFVYDTVSHFDPGNVTVANSTYANSWSIGAGNYGVQSFSYNITGLQEGTTYYYRSYTQNALGYDYSSTQQSFTTLQSVITTGVASGVGYSGSHVATLAGTLAPAGITWSEIGFGYGTVSQATPTNTTPPSPYTYNATLSGAYTSGSYSVPLTGLIEGATYYFRGYAKDSNGYWWSSTQNSWTAFSHPNITTVAATEIGAVSAKLQAALTWDGGQASDVRFGYDTSSHATVATYGNQTGWVENTYSTGSTPQQYIYGLAPSTLYYYRAVARNDVPGDKDAPNELTFTTASGVNPPTNLVANPASNSILVTWIPGTGSSTTVIRYKLLEYPTGITDGILLANTTTASATLSGLASGMTYYFMGWGWSGTPSSSNTTALATTSAGVVTNVTTSNFTTPSNWYQNSTGSGFATNPFRTVVNDTAAAYEMPESTVWMILALLLSMAAGIWMYSINSNLMLAMIVVGTGIGFSVMMGLLPAWVLFAYIIFALAIVVISTRYGG
jgi:hypothetical protein